MTTNNGQSGYPNQCSGNGPSGQSNQPNQSRHDRLTPSQRRIMDVLSDGYVHTAESLMKCLWDEMSGVGALRWQLCSLRKVLRPRGEDISTIRIDGVTYHQWVRIIGRGE